MSVAPTPLKPRKIRDQVSAEEWKTRVDLAAFYRLVVHFGMTDLIYNHISAHIPNSEHILINSYGMHYEEVTASSLQKIDIDGNVVLKPDNEFGINPAGYIIHSAIHSAREDAGCVIHTHTRAAVAVSAMKAGLLPLSQTAMMFYGRVGYHDFEGPAVNLEERKRLVADLGDKDVMLLRNHGTLVVGRNVPHTFLLAYQFENACKMQIDALSGGQPLSMPPTEVCEASAIIMNDPRFATGAQMEWAAMLRLLDRRDPSYAD